MLCYLIIASIIAIVAINVVFKPVLDEALEDEVVNRFTQNQKLTYGVLFVLSILIAPLLALLLALPITAVNQAKKGISQIVFLDDEDLLD